MMVIKTTNGPEKSCGQFQPGSWNAYPLSQAWDCAELVFKGVSNPPPQGYTSRGSQLLTGAWTKFKISTQVSCDISQELLMGIDFTEHPHSTHVSLALLPGAQLVLP